MRRVPSLVACLLLLATGCGRASPERAAVVVDTAGGEVRLAVELADTPAERSRGLMGRTSLPERAGMVFRFAADSRASFWMKDTPIPLSIAFIDGHGRILAILDMEPCRADPCPTYDPGVAYRAALEVNRGAFGRLGVAIGDVVRVEG